MENRVSENGRKGSWGSAIDDTGRVRVRVCAPGGWKARSRQRRVEVMEWVEEVAVARSRMTPGRYGDAENLRFPIAHVHPLHPSVPVRPAPSLPSHVGGASLSRRRGGRTRSCLWAESGEGSWARPKGVGRGSGVWARAQVKSESVHGPKRWWTVRLWTE